MTDSFTLLLSLLLHLSLGPCAGMGSLPPSCPCWATHAWIQCAHCAPVRRALLFTRNRHWTPMFLLLSPFHVSPSFIPSLFFCFKTQLGKRVNLQKHLWLHGNILLLRKGLNKFFWCNKLNSSCIYHLQVPKLCFHVYRFTHSRACSPSFILKAWFTKYKVSAEYDQCASFSDYRFTASRSQSSEQTQPLVPPQSHYGNGPDVLPLISSTAPETWNTLHHSVFRGEIKVELLMELIGVHHYCVLKPLHVDSFVWNGRRPVPPRFSHFIKEMCKHTGYQ